MTSETTYRVLKNGRKIPNKVFATYEKARQFVRKRIRSSKDRFNLMLFESHSDMKWRTPSLFSHNYSIKRVEV